MAKNRPTCGEKNGFNFRELARNNVLKVAGGFALGLLAANLMGKKTRKNVGKAVLVGSVAAGIPLGIKVLNNNRKLVTAKDGRKKMSGIRRAKSPS